MTDIEVTGDVGFGSVSPLGAVDPAVAERLEVVTAALGASYVIPEAVEVRVTSNGPWSLDRVFLDPSVGDGAGGGTGMLAWRRSGTSRWIAFGHDEAPGGACLLDQPQGTTTLAYDIRLRVDRTDPPAAVVGHVVLGATIG